VFDVFAGEPGVPLFRPALADRPQVRPTAGGGGPARVAGVSATREAAKPLPVTGGTGARPVFGLVALFAATACGFWRRRANAKLT
jgi:MYXO-CTERM domain-containing protein